MCVAPVVSAAPNTISVREMGCALCGQKRNEGVAERHASTSNRILYTISSLPPDFLQVASQQHIVAQAASHRLVYAACHPPSQCPPHHCPASPRAPSVQRCRPSSPVTCGSSFLVHGPPTAQALAFIRTTDFCVQPVFIPNLLQRAPLSKTSVKLPPFSPKYPKKHLARMLMGG